MDPAAHACAASTALGTGAPGTSTCASLIACLYKTEASWGRKRSRLALQVRVVCRMFRKDVVEDGEKPGVALERVWGWGDGSCSADCEGGLRGICVEVGEEIAVWYLRVREDFLGRK
jgi:hypothetical protein